MYRSVVSSLETREGLDLCDVRPVMARCEQKVCRSVCGPFSGSPALRWARLSQSRVELLVGRKNWMFAGNDDSGKWAAVMYSLIRSCELNGVEPWKHLRDVLSRRAEGWPEERLGELLPHRWSALAN